MKCTEPNCVRDAIGKGRCGKHYASVRRRDQGVPERVQLGESVRVFAKIAPEDYAKLERASRAAGVRLGSVIRVLLSTTSPADARRAAESLQ